MSTDRDTQRLVRSWLEEGVTRLPDRVLDSVLDQVPATPQRRPLWSAWRPNQMNTYAKLGAAAAAVLVVAVVGYQLLPGRGPASGAPTVAPSPSPSLLARGTFKAKGANVVLNATGSGSNVSGTMTVSDVDLLFTVDLECERTSATGLRWIGGDVTQSNFNQYAPEGTRTAIVLKPGSPALALFIFQMSDPRADSCQAFFDDMIAQGGEPTPGPDGLEPIEGTVELAP
jgi:hypothetical protein